MQMLLKNISLSLGCAMTFTLSLSFSGLFLKHSGFQMWCMFQRKEEDLEKSRGRAKPMFLHRASRRAKEGLLYYFMTDQNKRTL